MRARSTPSTVIRPARRRVHVGQQLHERALAGAVLADERDHRARRELDVHVGRALRGRCPGTRTTRARSGCRRVMRSGTSTSACGPCSPRSPRATRAGATSRARCRGGSRARRPRRRRTARAGCRRSRTSTTLPTLASSPTATNTIAPTYAPPKSAHASVCHSAVDHAGARDRLVPLRPTTRGARAAAADPMPDDPHLLARRRGRAQRRTGAWRGGRAARPLSSTRRSTPGPPGRRDHDRDREQREEHEHRARPRRAARA